MKLQKSGARVGDVCIVITSMQAIQENMHERN